jgi:hypothetical protein
VPSWRGNEKVGETALYILHDEEEEEEEREMVFRLVPAKPRRQAIITAGRVSETAAGTGVRRLANSLTGGVVHHAFFGTHRNSMPRHSHATCSLSWMTISSANHSSSVVWIAFTAPVSPFWLTERAGLLVII